MLDWERCAAWAGPQAEPASLRLLLISLILGSINSFSDSLVDIKTVNNCCIISIRGLSQLLTVGQDSS